MYFRGAGNMYVSYYDSWPTYSFLSACICVHLRLRIASRMPPELEHTIEVLERTPQVLRALLGGLSDFWLTSNYGPDTFSPFDVVGHLIHAKRTNWMPRARLILSHG